MSEETAMTIPAPSEIPAVSDGAIPTSEQILEVMRILELAQHPAIRTPLAHAIRPRLLDDDQPILAAGVRPGRQLLRSHQGLRIVSAGFLR